MTIDFYYNVGSAPCRPILMLAKALGVQLNLKEVNIPAGDTRTPEFLKVSHILNLFHFLNP